MKQIITSVGMIVFAGAIIAGATGAFFSDTETSTGNVFTAGAIDLTVDSEQHYNNAVCEDGVWVLDEGETEDSQQYPVLGTPCTGTWLPADLGAQTFFNFNDVKPGDEGENTISLHVDNNDAYACVDVSLVANDDVSSAEPELEDGDSAESGSLFDGELAQNMDFFAWADTGVTPGFQGISDPGEGDNVWQANEAPLFSNVIGSASDVLDGESYTLAAPGPLGVLAGGSTSYIGLAWCAGTLTAPVPGTLVCDGASMGNVVQTDSMVANIAFRVEQARNNPNFSCGDIEGGANNVVNQDDIETDQPTAIANGDWFFYNDTNDTLMTLNEFSGSGGVNEIVAGPDSVGAAQMTLHDSTARYNIATYRYDNVLLSGINSLSYRMYDDSASAETPFLHFNVSYDGLDTWQGRLVQVPTGVVTDTWTEVDALAGMWTKTSGNWPVGVTTAVPFSGLTPRTWADIIADYPSAETRTTDSFFGIRVGHPGPATETGFVDWIEFDGETTDFEI